MKVGIIGFDDTLNLQKKFVKGLRQYGKNFFRIKKELVPHKETVSCTGECRDKSTTVAVLTRLSDLY